MAGLTCLYVTSKLIVLVAIAAGQVDGPVGHVHVP